MKKSIKQSIHARAKKHVKDIKSNIIDSVNSTKKSTDIAISELKEGRSQDRAILSNLIIQGRKRISELEKLKFSPYFFRCDVILDAKNKKETWYFSKFNFSEKSIFSWASAAAIVRFEKPGDVYYKKPTGEMQKVKLIRKDQYIIVDGEIVFLATETIGAPRELIYQKHFSAKKGDFVLPEIVAQMEKAQDQVIRASQQGAFVISGPAGSGKTTLALHRVAYLVQSPDTMDFYSDKSVLVLVQDSSTKKYFEHLLPELGIKKVSIQTFFEWAVKVLGIKNVNEIVHFSVKDTQRKYEHTKLSILRNYKKDIPKYKKNIYKTLEKVYGKYLDDYQMGIFKKQKNKSLLDRFDLTILLESYKKTFGTIEEVKEYYEELNNGNFRERKGKFPIKYSLIVIDEFQNYLPEQLKILKECSDHRHKSIIYVGEMAQQIQLGTIKKWADIDEKIKSDRIVMLNKVYRNTKNILQYIKNLGYAIEVPKQATLGIDVVEKVMSTKKEEIQYIKKLIKESATDGVIGIIARDNEYLVEFKKQFKNNSKVHVFNIYETQGVEFDIVYLVGIDENTFNIKDKIDLTDFSKEELAVANKNLLYLALTRAISELHILGKIKLSKSIKKTP